MSMWQPACAELLQQLPTSDSSVMIAEGHFTSRHTHNISELTAPLSISNDTIAESVSDVPCSCTTFESINQSLSVCEHCARVRMRRRQVLTEQPRNLRSFLNESGIGCYPSTTDCNSLHTGLLPCELTACRKR